MYAERDCRESIFGRLKQATSVRRSSQSRSLSARWRQCEHTYIGSCLNVLLPISLDRHLIRCCHHQRRVLSWVVRSILSYLYNKNPISTKIKQHLCQIVTLNQKHLKKYTYQMTMYLLWLYIYIYIYVQSE